MSESATADGNQSSTDEVDATLREQEPPSVVRDIGITLVFMVLSVGFLIVSGEFADQRVSPPDPGAAFWPRAALIAILVAATINLIILYRRYKREDESLGQSIPKVDDIRGLSRNRQQYIAGVALMAVYFWSQEWLGFLVSTPIFLFIFAYTIGYRDYGKLLVYSIFVGLLIFFLFRVVMSVALPYGTGPFREVTVFASNLI